MLANFFNVKFICNVIFLQVIACLTFVGKFKTTSCDGLLSTLKPINFVFKFSKYVLAFASPIISVVHTGVKS